MQLVEEPLFLITEDSGLAIFPKAGFWFSGTNCQVAALKLLIDNPAEVPSDIVHQWKDYLTTNGLTQDTAEFTKRTTITQDSILSVGVSLTNICNIFCSHCYQDSSLSNSTREDVTTKEVVSFLEFLASKAPQSQKYVQFSGGEAFMRSDLLTIIQETLALGYQIRISTNGILLNKLNEQQMKILSDERIHPRVSIDGPDAESHGIYRPRASFSPAVNGLTKLASYNPNVGIKTVIHDKNVTKLQGIMDLVLEAGANHFTYNLLRSVGRAESGNLFRVSEALVFRELLKIVEQDLSYVAILKGTPFGNVIMSTHVRDYQFLSFFNFYLHCDGKVYPHSDLQLLQYLLHDIKVQPLSAFSFDKLEEMRKKYDVANQACCQLCLAQKFCFGGNYGTQAIRKKTLEGEFFECDDLRETVVSAMRIRNQEIVNAIIARYESPK